MNNATTTALDYWKKQPASIYGMMLNPEAEDLHRQEREQIINFLPDFSGKKILSSVQALVVLLIILQPKLIGSQL